MATEGHPIAHNPPKTQGIAALVPPPRLSPPLQIPPIRSGGVGAEPPLVALDPLETTSRPQQTSADDELNIIWPNPDALPFEHRGWDSDRRRIYASMIRTEQPFARRHAFARCRSDYHVYQEAVTKEIDIRPETCKDRFCLICGQVRSHRVARALEPRMKAAAAKLQFLTLTVRGRPGDSLSGQIEKLNAAWKALRKLDGWKNHVGGGAIMLEVKWSHHSGGHWHPHYHLITEGTGIDKEWLRHAWAAVTGDSDQIDVQWIKEPGKALSYVTKYASKPLDASFLRKPNLLDEALKSLKGRRLAALFGSWYGTPLKEEFDDEDTEVLTQWRYAGTIGDLEFRAGRGEADAKLLLSRVARLLQIRSAGHFRQSSHAADSQPPPSPAPLFAA